MSKLSKNKTILITAGPTMEPIDPVRYISNYSTGEMGYALAKAAKNRGYKVILISGPTALKPPTGVKFISVTTALEMRKAVLTHFRQADCVIMTAAVADFRPADFSARKLKKGVKKGCILRLTRNPDILDELGKRKGSRVLVGFSLETDDHLKNTAEKMKAKNLDIVAVNKVHKKTNPFGKGRKDFTIISEKGTPLLLKGVSKRQISHILLDKIEILW